MFAMAYAGDAGLSLIMPAVSSGAAVPMSLTWPASRLLSDTTLFTSGTALLLLGDLSSFAGLLPFPQVIKKIIGKEYVDIRELLPEAWQVKSENSPCCHSKHQRHSLLTEFNVWAECYATMSAILSTAYPAKVAHFFAYLRTIT